VPFRYQTGDEIRKGDRVLFHGEPGGIEFVADPLSRIPKGVGLLKNTAEA